MAGDSTQFLIDMAARLTGGEAAIGQLAELGDRMLAAGSSAVELEQTVERFTSALEESEAAVEAANSALAEGEQRYKQAEIAAERAAKAVEKLNESGKSGEAFAKRQADAAEKAEKAAAALKLEAAAVDALKSKAAAAASTQDSLSKGLKNVQSAAEKAAEAERKATGSRKVNEVAEGLGKLGGPLGIAGQKVLGAATGFDKLVKSLGTAGGYVAIAVAITAIATAAIAATFAIAKWGVSLADANRTQTLLAAGIARSRDGGAELEKTVGKLADIVPQSSDELYSMAKGLSDAGLRGKDLTNALERTAVTAAKLKWGPDFQKQILSIDNQTRRLQSNIADTFGGLNIDKLLVGVQRLVLLFDSTTESGKTMKFLFETLFQPVVDGAADATVTIERLFLHAEILALKAFIALRPYRTEIENVGKALLLGAAIIGGVFVGALVIVAGALALVIAGIGKLASDIYELVNIVPEAIDLFQKQLAAELENMANIGVELVNGLIAGITSGAKALADSLVNTVSGGIDSLTSFLKIGSPSKLTFDMGVDTREGFTGGIEADGGAQSALEEMVAPPAGKGGGAGSRGGGWGGVTINITVDGAGESDEGLAQKIANRIAEVFDSDALALGAGEEPAT